MVIPDSSIGVDVVVADWQVVLTDAVLAVEELLDWTSWTSIGRDAEGAGVVSRLA
jgi:hypothetical protein